jgi:glutaredoxin
MKNLKKYQIPLLIIIALVAISLIIFFQNRPGMILFYSDSCPHCQNVNKYINDNGLKDKLKFQELEVSQPQNKTNAALLEKKARQCGLDVSQGLGVPFFFDGQKCLMGDQDIINYFQNTIKQ